MKAALIVRLLLAVLLMTTGLFPGGCFNVRVDSDGIDVPGYKHQFDSEDEDDVYRQSAIPPRVGRGLYDDVDAADRALGKFFGTDRP